MNTCTVTGRIFAPCLPQHDKERHCSAFHSLHARVLMLTFPFRFRIKAHQPHYPRAYSAERVGALITARIERSSIFCHATSTVAAAVVRTGYSIQNRKAEQLSCPSRYAKPVGQPVWLNSWLLGSAKSQYTSLVYSVHNLCTEQSPSQNRH